MLTLNEQQLKDLETYLLEIPAKFANPILQFLGQIKVENESKAIETTPSKQKK